MRSLHRLLHTSLRSLPLIPVENRTQQENSFCTNHRSTLHQHHRSSSHWGRTTFSYSDNLQPGEMKSVKVAIIGSPNVGKSTLLNSLMRQYISPVSNARKTTTHPVKGVITHEDTQVIFLDTPGMLPAEFRYSTKMKRTERSEYMTYYDRICSSVEEADCVLFLFDCSVPAYKLFISRDMAAVMDKIPEIPKILVLNKIDKERERAKIEQVVGQLTGPRPAIPVPSVALRTDVSPPIEFTEDIVEGRNFHEVLSVSAIRGTHIEYIWYTVRKCAVYRPWEYHPETVSPDDMESVVTSLVRAEMLTKYGYAQACNLDHKFLGYREEGDTLFVDHVIFTNRKLYYGKEDLEDSEASITNLLEARFGVKVQFKLISMKGKEKEQFLDLVEGSEPTIQILEK